MSYELRLRSLKRQWLKIQALRDEQKKLRERWREDGKRIRQIGQEIGDELEKYNKIMV